MESSSPPVEIEKVESPAKSKKRGGARPGSGRKPQAGKAELRTIKQEIEAHGIGVAEGAEKRRVVVLLDRLYEAGEKGNVPAIKEYFDRQIGKAVQPMEHSGKDGEAIKIDISSQLEKIYGVRPGEQA